MDSYTINQLNRLYWLGRYGERTLTMTQQMMDYYDRMIDGHSPSHSRICAALEIPDIYESDEDFTTRYLFDRQDQASVISSAELMLGNAMMLRETITSPTLAYVQMAYNAIETAAVSTSPCISLQWVIDDIMAFRGSCDDAVEDGHFRNSIKCGASIERLSLDLRLQLRLPEIPKEAKRLLSRLTRTHLPRNQEHYTRLMSLVYDQGLAEAQRSGELLKLVEAICEV